MNVQLIIFCLVAVFSIRGILDELIFLARPAPKSSKFTLVAQFFSWVGIGVCAYFVLNGMSFL